MSFSVAKSALYTRRFGAVHNPTRLTEWNFGRQTIHIIMCTVHMNACVYDGVCCAVCGWLHDVCRYAVRLQSARPTMGWGNVVAGKLCARRTRTFSLCAHSFPVVCVRSSSNVSLMTTQRMSTPTGTNRTRHAVVRLRELELSSPKWITQPYTRRF